MSAGGGLRWIVVGAVVLLAGGGVMIAGSRMMRSRPGIGELLRATRGPASGVESIPASAGTITGADRSVRLPGEPIGLAWNGQFFLACNRKDPWGFLKMTPTGSGLDVQTIEVTEPAYDQRIGCDSVTWNGTNFVAVVNATWFQLPEGLVFTVHDPATLQVLRHAPAPERIGAIAWDGSGYWAATRNNTETSGETPALYRLDPSFRVLVTTQPPSVGTQGLAWDGSRLWSADVFTGSLYEMDVASGSAAVVSTHPLGLDYPSGAVHDGRNLWLADYDTGSVHRVSAATVASWRGLPAPTESVEMTPGAAATAAGGAAADPARVADLREKLWAEDGSDRFGAEIELERMGVAKDRDRHTEAFPDLGREDTDLLDFRVELRGNDLYGSWTTHFGEDLFTKAPATAPGSEFVSMPTFARYTITIRGGTLPQEVEREFEAVPGRSSKMDEVLVRNLGPGKYDASVFMHVQYVTPDGGNRILNDSAGSVDVELR